MSKARVEVSGGRELLNYLQRMGPRGAAIGIEVLDQAATKVVARAKAIVPVDGEDGGDLRDTIRKTKPNKTRAGRISVGIVAGGSKLAKLASERGKKSPGAYAVVQHEDTTLAHPGGGQAKYIEGPVLEEAPSIPGALLEAIKRG